MESDLSGSPEEVCSRIYKETNDFYVKIMPNLAKNKADLGFQILYGPPFAETRIFFIGYQPGKGTKTPEQERNDGSEDRWPPICEYATESWRLASNMRRMFGKTLLESCVGINAIFFRSWKIQNYCDHVDADIRARIEEFCLPRVAEIVRAIRPKVVVAIGLAWISQTEEVHRG
jgi:uracil-DNA glycosylase